MNITGDKSQFAVEWEVTAAYEKDCYGSFCFWINETQVGDLSCEVHLDASLYHYDQFLRHKNIRAYRKSPEFSKEELFYQLHERFFGDKAKEIGDYLNLGIYRAIFWAEEIGDASIRDKWNILVIDEPALQRQRIIWKRLDAPDQKYEAFLTSDVFDDVLKQFCEQVLIQWKETQSV